MRKPMKVALAETCGTFLTRPQPALRLAEQIVRRWNDEPVVLDFADVLQMTPSFANALVLTLLHVDSTAFRSKLAIENAAPHLQSAWDRAVARKQRGIELTAYTLDPATPPREKSVG